MSKFGGGITRYVQGSPAKKLANDDNDNDSTTSNTASAVLASAATASLMQSSSPVRRQPSGTADGAHVSGGAASPTPSSEASCSASATASATTASASSAPLHHTATTSIAPLASGTHSGRSALARTEPSLPPDGAATVAEGADLDAAAGTVHLDDVVAAELLAATSLESGGGRAAPSILVTPSPGPHPPAASTPRPQPGPDEPKRFTSYGVSERFASSR